MPLKSIGEILFQLGHHQLSARGLNLTNGAGATLGTVTGGSGSPEGSETAKPGSIYLDFTNGALYVKQSGTDNTGWAEAGSGGAVAIGDLTGVTLTDPQTDEVLKYDGNAWVNATAPSTFDPDTTWDTANAEKSALLQVTQSLTYPAVGDVYFSAYTAKYTTLLKQGWEANYDFSNPRSGDIAAHPEAAAPWTNSWVQFLQLVGGELFVATMDSSTCTSGSSPPDFAAATNHGDTVVDGTVTWYRRIVVDDPILDGATIPEWTTGNLYSLGDPVRPKGSGYYADKPHCFVCALTVSFTETSGSIEPPWEPYFHAQVTEPVAAIPWLSFGSIYTEGTKALELADAAFAVVGSSNKSVFIGPNFTPDWDRHNALENSVCIGLRAGYAADGDGNLYAGVGAGTRSRLSSSVAIGDRAGQDAGFSGQAGYDFFLGSLAGIESSLSNSIAIGDRAGERQAGDSDTSIGASAGYYSNGNYNAFLGVEAGYELAGNSNLCFGQQAGKTLAGDENTVVGALGTAEGLAGNRNVCLGSSAGVSLVGNNNVIVGDYAGSGVRSGYNTVIGPEAGANLDAGPLVSGMEAVAIGYYAGRVAAYAEKWNDDSQSMVGTSYGTNGVYIGSYAGEDSKLTTSLCIGYSAGSGARGVEAGAGSWRETGQTNAYIGSFAGSQSVGSNNLFFGSYAGANSDGDNNTFIGPESGTDACSQNATGLGRNAGYNHVGYYNILIGDSAGDGLYGDYNICIGSASGQSVTTSNTIYLGWTQYTATYLYGVIYLNNDLVLPSETTQGIKVDPATPTWTWRDIIGNVAPKSSGAGSPTRTVYNGGTLAQMKFIANDLCDFEFHIPHDYVPGTDLHFHVHWSHNGTDISGSAEFDIFFSYAKGHNQANFSAEKTQTITYATTNIATTPQYRHRIDETQISTNGGAADKLDTSLIEVDGVILVTLKLKTLPTITAGALFIHTCDVHYQSTNIGTKNKAPAFYTT